MPRRTVATLATVSVAATVVSVLAAAPRASADLITHCIGTGGAVTVPNDLYVPAGQSCTLTGTTVTGNVSVAVGANLVVAGGRLNGEVRVAADGYLDAADTTIGGAVVLTSGGYGVFLKHSRSGPVTVQPRGSASIDGFLFVEETTIAGGVTASAGEVRLDRTTQVEGDVSSTGTHYTDVHDSFVDGTLSVRGSATGSVVCASAVRGAATFTGNLGGVQLGPNGALDGCASGGYWGRDVSITNTTGGSTVDDNIIDGRLTTSANDPAARIATNNRIRGGIVGEQAPAAAGTDQNRAAPTGAARVRGNAGKQRAQGRRSSAVRKAVAAGDAGL
jgi:hypothetical protein